MNASLEQFVARKEAELELSRNELHFWNDLIERGIITKEHAAGYVKIEQGIVNRILAMGLGLN